MDFTTPYFVMLLNSKGTAFFPLLDNDDELLMFEDEREARTAAEENHYGRSYGYEVFCQGCGESTN